MTHGDDSSWDTTGESPLPLGRSRSIAVPADPPKNDLSLDLLAPDVTRGLVARLRIGRLLARFPERPVWAAFMFVNGFVTIGILAALAMLTRAPFVFPSLGPTAFLFFFSPTSPTASPRHTLLGHAIGIACGYSALWMTGLQDAAPALAAGVDLHRVLAAALSLSLTGSLMILLKVAHPPAGATTLIISLGIVTRPTYLLLIEIAVALMTLQAIAINRLAGLDYPLWAKRQPAMSRKP
jgi:CBS-domain-containing membrane protein